MFIISVYVIQKKVKYVIIVIVIIIIIIYVFLMRGLTPTRVIYIYFHIFILSPITALLGRNMQLIINITLLYGILINQSVTKTQRHALNLKNRHLCYFQ